MLASALEILLADSESRSRSNSPSKQKRTHKRKLTLTDKDRHETSQPKIKKPRLSHDSNSSIEPLLQSPPTPKHKPTKKLNLCSVLFQFIHTSYIDGKKK